MTLRRTAFCGVVLLFAGWLIWFSVLFTTATVLGVVNPNAAVRYWPIANAQASQAALAVRSTTDRATAAEARDNAIRALRRSPVNAIAAGSLGLAYSLLGDNARASTFADFAEQLSRREVPTELWLIERHVQRNDIDGALRHYNHALSTSPEIAPVLLPVLVAASSDPQIANDLGSMLAARPPWWESFIDALLSTGRSPDAVLRVSARMKLNSKVPAERVRLASAISRLVDFGAFTQANELYGRASGSAAPARQVRDGEFSRIPIFSPLDWRISDNELHSGVLEPRDGANGPAMSLYGEQPGEAARQLLTLAPGRYRLTAMVGDVVPTLGPKPVVAILCAGQRSDLLSRVEFPIAQTTARISAAFLVPVQNCGAQWLVINTGLASGDNTASPWIDSISVAAVRTATPR